jgi:c-di-GMP-related signal transduction protein
MWGANLLSDFTDLDVMDVFVARQPIFDRQRRIFAYELLFRSDAHSNQFTNTNATVATSQVVANTLFAVGLEDILRGKKAFINFGRDLILGGWESMLPRDKMVIELLENVEPDEEIIATCRRLRDQGYAIALDDFVYSPRFEPLAELATIIKVDLRSTPRSEQLHLLRTYQPKGVRMLAEKVETQEEYEWAFREGFDYFQGYFFARPEVMRGKQIPASKMTCLRLLQEVQKTDLDFDLLTALVSEDVGFSYKLLRFVNSALFPHRSKINSILQALVTLGEPGVRHWVAVAALPRMAADKPRELVVHSLLRARFCETVAQSSSIPNSGDAFLTGLFSLLDALIDRPLDVALAEINLAPSIAGALLGTAPDDDDLTNVINLVCRYEAGEWDAVDSAGRQLGADGAMIGQAYRDAAVWANQLLSASW